MLDKPTLKCSTKKLCLFEYGNHWFHASLSAVAQYGLDIREQANYNKTKPPYNKNKNYYSY